MPTHITPIPIIINNSQATSYTLTGVPCIMNGVDFNTEVDALRLKVNDLVRVVNLMQLSLSIVPPTPYIPTTIKPLTPRGSI